VHVVKIVRFMTEKLPESGPIYKCLRCEKEVYLTELERYVSFRCPECGYRVFKKVRPSIVKRLKAR
jgi:DNA-directed RNA polymerase subunit RPC12/RpoP